MRFAVLSVAFASLLALPLSAAAQAGRPSPFDGNWSGVWSCGTSIGGRAMSASAGQPYTAKRTAVIRNGTLEIISGTQGLNGYRELTGQVASDGSVSLNGYGLGASEGNRYRIWTTGRIQGEVFQGSGGEGDRSCIVELRRDAQPRPQPLPGQVTTAQAQPGRPPGTPQQVSGPVYDGLYRGHFDCAGRRNAKPGGPDNVRIRREIVISQAQASYEWIGDKVEERAAGRIDPNGRVVLQGVARNAAGQQFGVAINAQIEGIRLIGDATIAERHCTVELSRVGMSVPGPQQAMVAPPQPAAPPQAVPQPQVQPAALTAFDGSYRGQVKCGPSEADRRAGLPTAGPMTFDREISVQAGTGRLVFGSEGRPGSQYADGKVGGDGRLTIEGRGITSGSVTYPIRLDLDMRNGAAAGSGRMGDRTCEVQLSKGDAKIQEARATETPKPAAQSEADGSKALLELALWDAVKNSNDAKLYQDYLKKYPSGHFSAVATSRVAEIQKGIKPDTASVSPAIDMPSEMVNEKRLALVIGNSDYQNLGKLANPLNDAKAMATALRRLNFTVIERTNVTRDKMSDAIDEFGSKLQAGGVGLFFFAGHGMQVRGQNYLMPVEANPRTEVEVQGKAVNASYVLEHMSEARNRVNLVILDACRNNPLQVSAFRSATRGLAVVGRAPGGTIIAYATAPDAVAEDGDERNGLYTSELLKHLETPGLKVEDVFKRVTAGVRQRSSGNQVPWTTGSLEGDFYFKIPGRRG